MAEEKVNPFAALVRSRKFWLVVLDAIAAVLGLWIGTLVSPEMAKRIMTTWGILSGVLAFAIVMIAYEDKARLETKARQFEATAYAERERRYETLAETAPSTGAPHDIVILTGLVHTIRGFRSLSVDSALTFFKKMYGVRDLTSRQEATFRAAFTNARMRAAVDNSWQVYDEERGNGAIPPVVENESAAANSPWFDVQQPTVTSG